MFMHTVHGFSVVSTDGAASIPLLNTASSVQHTLVLFHRHCFRNEKNRLLTQMYASGYVIDLW